MQNQNNYISERRSFELFGKLYLSMAIFYQIGLLATSNNFHKVKSSVTFGPVNICQLIPS